MFLLTNFSSTPTTLLKRTGIVFALIHKLCYAVNGYITLEDYAVTVFIL
jgi:hypothetical protein